MSDKKLYKFYSQYGEDFIIWEFFDYKPFGFFVDVGAFDGQHISNSFSFEENGWKGICIEPNPRYYKMCRDNRPESFCVNAACGDKEGSIVLHTDKIGLFSTTIRENDKTSLNQHYDLLQKEPELQDTEVRMVTLNSLLEKYKDHDLDIDFVSIDVEGAEISVLNGLDINKYRPTILVVETSSEESCEIITEYLQSYDYILARRNQANSYYVKSMEDAEKLRQIENTCSIEKQIHPLGSEYTNPEYIFGKTMYKGKYAISQLRELENILDNYLIEKLDDSVSVPVKLKQLIEERRDKLKKMNEQLIKVQSERNEKVSKQNDKLDKLQEINDQLYKKLGKLINQNFDLNKDIGDKQSELEVLREELEARGKRTLTIITVTYNAKEDLIKTIKSLRQQKGVNFEYVIIDGGSTDGSLDIIEDNSDIVDVILTEKDGSIYEAMNKGLVLASGFYVQFLNAGDVFSDDHSLYSIYNILDKRIYHLVYGDINIYNNGKYLCQQKAMDFNIDRLLKFGTGVLCHQAMFVRKDVAPLYNLKYRFKGELCWYFDICERLGDKLEYIHLEIPIVDYSLGGFGYKYFIKNRIDWLRVVRDKYGYKVIWENNLLGFLYRNSLTRYPKLKKFDSILGKMFFRNSKYLGGVMSLFKRLFGVKAKVLTCSICGFSAREFNDYKGSYYIMGELVDHFTKDSICPECKSDIRHRFIYKFLKDKTDVFLERKKMLHLAPEKWLATKFLQMDNIEYTAGDIEPHKFDYIDAIYVDNTRMDFPDESFDSIISIHVLEHISEDLKAIDEMYRVLKHGGWALIAVPIYGESTYEDTSLDSEGRTKMYGLDEHVRMNGLDIAEKFRKAGFRVEIYELDDLEGNFYNETVSSPHIDSDKYLFYCTK